MSIRKSNEYEKMIYDLLLNPGRYDHFSFHDTLYSGNRDVVFSTLLNEENPASPAECAAYLYGKACEALILYKTRNNFKRIWISPEEVTNSIVLNLPTHFEEIVIEMMDGCENACEKFLSEKEQDVKTLLLNIQYIAEKICNDDKVYNETVEGYSNNDIVYPSEAYVFANNAILKQLIDMGYKVNGVSDNPNSPVSCVLESPEGEKMVVLENVTIYPKTAKFYGYLKDALKKVAEKEDAKPYLLGIMLEPEDDKQKELGIVVKNGKNLIKRTDFMKA